MSIILSCLHILFISNHSFGLITYVRALIQLFDQHKGAECFPMVVRCSDRCCSLFVFLLIMFKLY
jgi:hypothetical protein